MSHDETMRTVAWVTLLIWMTAGLIAIALLVRLGYQNWRRQKSRLPCEVVWCRKPAQNIWVWDDFVRGLCDQHFAEEYRQEMRSDDGDREQEHDD